MSDTCFRCKQTLKREYRSCITCFRSFHPSCFKIYISYRGANSCCLSKSTSSSQMAIQLSTTSSRSMSSLSSPTSLDNAAVQPTLQLASLESKITDFMAQQTLFNNHLSEILNNKSNQLKEIKNIAKSVSDQQLRITKLEKHNASLSKNVSDIIEQNKSLALEVSEIKNSLNNVTTPSSPQIIISGVPNQLNLEPHDMFERTLAELDAPQLVNDVLDIRQVVKNKNNNSQSMSSNTKSSYIVKFKSEHVVQHIIMLKRRKGSLTIDQVFNCKLP
ncbi:hypothetical protein PV326_001633, partial [Microctonus aethiopoides]